MLVPKSRAEAETEIKKSRFIATAFPCRDAAELKKAIAEQREKHPGARHVCHAAVMGNDGSLFSLSDDKEPKGTAGRPMLEVLKGSGITDIGVTVVRYFGGTLLGTGGLVKAYGGAVKAVLEVLETEEKTVKNVFEVRFPHRFYSPVRRAAETLGAAIVSEEAAEDMKFVISVKADLEANLKSEISERCSGGAVFSPSLDKQADS